MQLQLVQPAADGLQLAKVLAPFPFDLLQQALHFLHVFERLLK